MAHKIVHPKNAKSPDDIIRWAESNTNADVKPNDHGPFTAIRNKAGEKMLMKPGRDTMDKKTKGNVLRWLKVLGLIVLPFVCFIIDFYWFEIRNIIWIIQHS